MQFISNIVMVSNIFSQGIQHDWQWELYLVDGYMLKCLNSLLSINDKN